MRCESDDGATGEIRGQECQVDLPWGSHTVYGDPQDGYFKAVQAHADGLAPLAAWLQSNIRRDACIADVGANIGLTAMLMSRAVPDGHVFAFEPSPRTAAFLRRNVQKNGLHNITVVEAAVGAKPGTAKFSFFDYYSAGSRVSESGSCEVPIIRLDQFCAERSVTLDFMKLDAEGYEPWVLAGARRAMRPGTPVWMEFNSLCLTTCGGNAVAFANSLIGNFDVQRFEPDQSLQTIIDGVSFVSENMTIRGCVEDVLMRLKPDHTVPSLAVMTGQTLDVSEG